MGDSCIHLDRSKDKGECPHRPIFGVDTLLQQYWRVSGIVVVINLMPELEMVKKGIGVNKTHIFANPASTSPASLRQSSINQSQRSIRCHQLHNIVFLFHREDLEVDAVQSAWEAIGGANLFQIEM